MTTPQPPTPPQSESHDQLRGHLYTLYRAVVEERLVPENYLGGYLRRHSAIRGGARGFLGATLFALLRARVRLLLQIRQTFTAGTIPEIAPFESLSAGLPAEDEAAFAILRWLREDLQVSPQEAFEMTLCAGGWAEPEAAPDPDRLQQFSQFLTDDPELLGASDVIRLAARGPVPVEVAERWLARFGAQETANLLEAMYRPAPLDLRANSRNKSAAALCSQLNSAGIPCETSRFAPTGVRLGRKVNLRQVSGLDEGDYEIQDEGSQLVCEALGAAEGWHVLDSCAGGGGKALHLSELVGDSGRVDAHDSDPARLKPLESRRRAAGAENVHIVVPGELAGPYDAVLIDAPCLGFGRLRRDPTVAWRQPFAQRLGDVVRYQRECLEEYAPLVRQDGILLYAVCSFELEETIIMIHSFLERWPEFQPDPLPPLFQSGPLSQLLHLEGSAVFLLPSIHETDGFFLARLKRTG